MSRVQLDLFKLAEEVEQKDKELIGDDDLQHQLDNEGKQKIEVITNRFGGGSCSLPSFAVAIYDVIMGCEQLRMYNTQQKGLSWFSRNFTSQYMVLLD